MGVLPDASASLSPFGLPWTPAFPTAMNILPGVVSGFMLAFITSFDEVTMTVFIASPRTETLPVRLFLYIQDNIDPMVASISACLIAVTVVAMILLDRAYGLDRLFVGAGKA